MRHGAVNLRQCAVLATDVQSSLGKRKEMKSV